MTERERQILGWIRENPMISQQELADKAGIARSSAAVHISNLMKKGMILGKGYIIRQENDVVVIGSIGMDTWVNCDHHSDSSVHSTGRILVSLGGVGRNIAHNLRLLEQPVRMITAFGEDMNGEKLQASCTELGIDVGDALFVPGAVTSGKVSIIDENGKIQTAVSDLRIYDHMTPEFVAGKLDTINRAGVCVMDTNLPADTIEFLAERVEVPLFVDPISSDNRKKLSKVLGRIHTFMSDWKETENLTGIQITDESSLKLAAGLLLNAGMKRIFISLGEEGVFCADREHNVLLPGIPVQVTNAIGGRECFMAGLVYAYRRGMTLEESGRMAMAACAICMEGEHTINEELSVRALYDRAGLLYPEDALDTEWTME